MSITDCSNEQESLLINRLQQILFEKYRILWKQYKPNLITALCYKSDDALFRSISHRILELERLSLPSHDNSCNYMKYKESFNSIISSIISRNEWLYFEYYLPEVIQTHDSNSNSPTMVNLAFYAMAQLSRNDIESEVYQDSISSILTDLYQEVINFSPLSLSSLWKFIGYSGNYPLISISKDENVKVDLDEDIQLLLQEINSVVPISNMSCRYHDPNSEINNLFSLCESRLYYNIYQLESGNRDPIIFEGIVSCIMCSLGLAIKSGRLLFILRCLCEILIVMQLNSELDFDVLLPEKEISLLISDFKDFKLSLEELNNLNVPVSTTLESRYQMEMYKELNNRVSRYKVIGGTLITFGKAEYGKLGHGDNIVNYYIPTAVEYFHESSIVKVSSTTMNMLVLDEDGFVYYIGAGLNNTTMNTDPLTNKLSRREVKPRKLHIFPRLTTKVVNLSCGLMHSLLLLEDGKVLSFGSGMNGRLGSGDGNDRFDNACVVHFSDESTAVAVECGASHSLILDCNGRVYTFGKNSQGQCGIGTTEDCYFPKLVDLPGMVIQKIAAGWEHTMMLTETGKLLSCGGGFKDIRRTGIPPVLGLGTTQSCNLPKEISSIDSIVIVDIQSGWDHCLALDNVGRVLSWGSGSNGKLGHNCDENYSMPCVINSLENIKIVAISTGCEHSACIDEKGNLYTWGLGDFGRLGHGDSTSQFIPTRVESLKKALLR